LLRDFKDLKKHPVEGFVVDLPNDKDLFTWEVYIQGPPDTFYEGATYRAILRFPDDYPYTPPKMLFTSEVWHPNVYLGGPKSGEVCISILHPPGGNPDMPDECESDAERWNPAHSVTTIILSVISMLSDPNFSSPANIDASVQWRRDIENFKKRVKETILKSNKQLPPGFEFPKPTKPIVDKSMILSCSGDLEMDDPDDEVATVSSTPSSSSSAKKDEFEIILSELEGMGFDRAEIKKVIKNLQDSGKKVHQDSIMEKLCQ